MVEVDKFCLTLESHFKFLFFLVFIGQGPKAGGKMIKLKRKKRHVNTSSFLEQKAEIGKKKQPWHFN